MQELEELLPLGEVKPSVILSQLSKDKEELINSGL